MVDSLKSGRGWAERSIRERVGGGLVVSDWVCLDLMVSRTNWAIWGQTRGCLVLQIMMPILGEVVGVAIVCRMDGWV